MSTSAVDYEQIKQRQQGVWASGDYASVASTIVPMAELLCEDAGVRAGQRVLDVACGSGNAAIAAARRFCEVTGLDYVPDLLQRASERAAAEGLLVTFVEGDAEAMPFRDETFDRVLSCVGVMFAPDQERAAAELVRVCRPGGTIALACWTPEGFVGDLLRLVGSHAPPAPGVRPATLWGDEGHVRTLLSDAAAVACERRSFTFHAETAEDLADFFISRYGPTLKASASLDDAGRDAFRTAFCDLVRSHDDAVEGSVAVPAEYLTALARR